MLACVFSHFSACTTSLSSYGFGLLLRDTALFGAKDLVELSNLLGLGKCLCLLNSDILCFIGVLSSLATQNLHYSFYFSLYCSFCQLENSNYSLLKGGFLSNRYSQCLVMLTQCVVVS